MSRTTFHELLMLTINGSDDQAEMDAGLDALLGEFGAVCGDGAEDFFLFGLGQTLDHNDPEVIKAFADCCNAFMQANRSKARAA